MFYVIFMKPASNLKNLSRYNYALWWNISARYFWAGHFKFQDFQLNKIIGFFLVLSFMWKHLFSLVANISLSVAPTKFLHIYQTMCTVNPQETKQKKNSWLNFKYLLTKKNPFTFPIVWKTAKKEKEKFTLEQIVKL